MLRSLVREICSYWQCPRIVSMNLRMNSLKRAFGNLALGLRNSALPSTDLPDDANQKRPPTKNNPLLAKPKSPIQLPLSRPSQRGVSRSSLNAGRGAVDAAASGAQTSSQGGPLWGFVSERTARRRPMLKRLASDFGGRVPSPSRLWRGACCVRPSRVVLAPVAGVTSAEDEPAQPGRPIHQSADNGG